MLTLTANVPEKYQHIDFKPPQGVADEAEKGLEYRKKQGADKAGLTTEEAGEQGIGSGVQRAVNLKNRVNVSPEVIGKMVGFFARHEKNKDIAEEHEGTPWKDKGYVSWLLWGGDAGKTWAEKVKAQIDSADEKAKKTSSRIARDVLTRTLCAGNLEPPPEMFEKALKWFQGVIARRVLEKVEMGELLYQAPDASSQYEETPMAAQDVLFKVADLVSLHSTFHSMGRGELIYGREESVLTTEGPLKVKLLPSKRVELNWKGHTIEAPQGSFGFSQAVNPWLQKLGVKSKRERRDYVDHKRQYDSVDMSPEQRESKLRELSHVRDMYRGWEGKNRGIDTPLKVDLKGWYRSAEEFGYELPPLWMEVKTSPGSINGGFISVSDTPIVMIEIPNDVVSIAGSREMIQKLEDLLKHEMRHYAQYLFRLYRDVEEKGSMYGNEAYLPHALRTLEYDTIVADEITELRRYLVHVPGHLHSVVFKAWTNALTSRDKADLADYKAWVKVNPKHHLPSRFEGKPLKPEEGRSFFRLTRENDTSKWKRAVKTLARNVNLSRSTKRSHMPTKLVASRVVTRILREKLPVIASMDPVFAYDLYYQEDLNRGNNSSREEFPTTDVMSDRVLQGLQERIDALSEKIEEYQDRGVDHSGLYDDREDLIRERDGIQRFLSNVLDFERK